MCVYNGHLLRIYTFQQLLKNYFAHIYRIQRIVLLRDESGYHRRDKYLFFHYLVESANRNFAKMVLREGIRGTWKNQDFSLSLAPFWLQPCFKSYIRNSFPRNCDFFLERNYLGKLNDDCLTEISKYLPLRDQINLMKLSNRFEVIIDSKIKFTETDYLFTDKKDLYYLFLKKGYSFKEVILTSENDHVLFLCHLLSKFCKNLKILRIQIYLESDFARILEFRKILYRFEKLEIFQVDAEFDQNKFWKQTFRYLPESMKVLIVNEVGDENFVESFPFIPLSIDKIVFTKLAGLTDISKILHAVGTLKFFKEVNRPKNFTIFYTVTERLKIKLQNNPEFLEIYDEGNIILIEDASFWTSSFD
ncbi:uncharacterized protein LOC129612162 isoform X2 [Condylostylus longicornis]|uniref:uncharacterized protein LOC129612162 isoform X2 n=1 Tax=Condylostylus longicornis TaxID=2530218 RepID=UPI00244E0B5F|nr:uncharacterized protein LOC129612162 isoform X2 [Condylostylus longicornis]